MTKAAPFIATYRLQLNADFTFGDAAEICDYLCDLGISHLYLSPIFSARIKSTHGYDVTDPSVLSKERGGDKGFDQLMKMAAMQKPALGAIVDFVPNHMAACAENPYFSDVLRDGPHSQFLDLFDIYAPVKKQAPLLFLPFLGSNFDEALGAKQIRLSYNTLLGFYLAYYDNHFPLSYSSISEIIYKFIVAVTGSAYFAQKELDELLQYAQAIDREQIKKQPSYAELAMRIYEWLQKSSIRRSQLDAFLASAPHLFVANIAKRQYFKLEYWKSGTANYRRFFDVNELIATNMQNTHSREIFHARLSALFAKYSSLSGLRLDHIDGLHAPESYLDSLAPLTPRVWVEKILSTGEQLPIHWKTAGTTGYDFLNAVSHAMVDAHGFAALHDFHRVINKHYKSYESCERESRLQLIDETFRYDFSRLSDELQTLLAKHAIVLTGDEAFELVREFAVAHPVYRLYVSHNTISHDDRILLSSILTVVRKRVPAPLKAAVDALLTIPKGFLGWLARFAQYSGAALAKGVEDTAFYRYFPLLALNEVGGHPDLLENAPERLHSFLSLRQTYSPFALNASSTHDTKRSEDARARLIALSYHADEWLAQVLKWQQANAAAKTKVQSKLVPSEATEYFIYQTVVSVWPLDNNLTPNFLDRIKNYLTKALREAKQQSNWKDPDTAYESAVLNFVDKLDYKAIGEFVSRISEHAAQISLASLAIKILAPGIPDFYQGCELWDFSLVDPDNRRKVDYEEHRSFPPGAIKQWLTRELLHLRRDNAELFEKGEYLPLKIEGPQQSNFFAFARRHQNRWIIVVVSTGAADSNDNYLLLPKDAPPFLNFLEKEPAQVTNDKLRLSIKGKPVPAIFVSCDDTANANEPYR